MKPPEADDSRAPSHLGNPGLESWDSPQASAGMARPREREDHFGHLLARHPGDAVKGAETGAGDVFGADR